MVERIEFIRAGQAVGLTLRQLSQVLEIRDRGEVPCHHVADLLDARIHEVDERLRDLNDLRQDLEALRERAADFDPADCPPESVCRVIHFNA